MRALLSLLLKPFLLLAGFCVYLVLRLIEPWRLLRIGVLQSERIGGVVYQTECLLRLIALGREASATYVFFCLPPANRQIMTMIRRRLTVIESRWARIFHDRSLRPFISGTRFSIPNKYTLGDEFNRAARQMAFTAEEEARGRRILDDLGVGRAPFVCFTARDKKYLERVHSSAGEDWSYHNFRNSSIDNYLPAAEALAAEGIFALRMGHVVEKPIASAQARVIDYANRHRSDFGDIFLSTHCKFFLGDTTGLVCVPMAFDVPTAAANFTQISVPPWRETDIMIPKLCWDLARGRFLTFPEMIACGAAEWSSSKDFAAAGLDLQESSAEDILALALEMNARVDGTWIAGPDDDLLQERYRALYPPDHAVHQRRSRVGGDFLRRHRTLLD